ncbi:MAG: hypothetical protein ACQESP_12700 [Candidatus Muiribacteriota bacterium]
MNSTFLTTVTNNILDKVNAKAIQDTNITIINFEEADKSHLILEAPNPNELISLWEMITTFATIGSAIAFLQLIRNSLIEEKQQSTVRVTTNTGMSIEISNKTSDIQIEEFANKTVITIS